VKYKDDDAMYQLLLAQTYMDAKTPNDSLAKEHLKKAVAIESRLYRAQYLLGVVQERNGEAEAAAQQWSTAAKLAPTIFGKPFNSLGKLYIRWDFLDQAVQVLQAGVGKVTDPDEIAELRYHLGLAYAAQSKHKEAIAEYSASLEKRKGNADALRQRGASHVLLGDKESAKQDLEQFLALKGKGGNPLEVQTVNQMLFRLATEPE